MKRIALLILLCLWLAPLVTQAQDDACPSIVATALEATDSACDDTGRNQACYGNVQLAVEAREGADAISFEQQGDRVDVADVQTLTLSSMDTEAGVWGVALLRLQANIPDTLPGQNVTFLLFGDVAIENAVAEDSEEVLSPMQAFTFRSGIGDAPCEGAPDSGILIQTPEGAGEITLTANGVNITLASTIYLQAQPGGESLVVNALEGHVMVEDQVVPPGSRVHVPLDDELRATGPPSQPEPYEEDTLAVLPVDNLEREIVIPPALTAEEIEAALASTGETSGAVPVAGAWTFTYTGECSEFGSGPVTMSAVTADGLIVEGEGEVLELAATEPGVYFAEVTEEGATSTINLQVISPERMEGEASFSIGTEMITCPLVIDLVSAAG